MLRVQHREIVGGQGLEISARAQSAEKEGEDRKEKKNTYGTTCVFVLAADRSWNSVSESQVVTIK